MALLVSVSLFLVSVAHVLLSVGNILKVICKYCEFFVSFTIRFLLMTQLSFLSMDNQGLETQALRSLLRPWLLTGT